ncbi:unnamed protein product, partial [Didymodactylos carnosus]
MTELAPRKPLYSKKYLRYSLIPVTIVLVTNVTAPGCNAGAGGCPSGKCCADYPYPCLGGTCTDPVAGNCAGGCSCSGNYTCSSYASSPCQNGGTCVDNTGCSGYSCTCPTGYSGIQCQTASTTTTDTTTTSDTT